MRVGWLMIKSIGWIGAGAFLAVLLGLFAAIAVLYWQPGRLSRLVKPAFLMIIIPNFIYVQSWIYCMDTINGIINDLLHTSFNFTGSFAYLWVFAMASFPLTFGFSLFALQSVAKEIAYLVAMDGGDAKLFWHIYLPAGRPYLLSGFLLAAALSFYDFSMASSFGINMIGLELFSRFSAGASLGEVLKISAPFLGISLCILFFVSRAVEAFQMDHMDKECINPFQHNLAMKRVATIGAIILSIWVVVPLLFFVLTSQGADPAAVLLASTGEMTNSFALAGLSAIGTLALGGLMAAIASTGFARRPIRLLPVFFFAMPTPLLALGILRLAQNDTTGMIYRERILPVIGMAIKYHFIITLGLGTAIQRLDPDVVDALKLDTRNIWQQMNFYAHLLIGRILSLMILVFAFCLGEYAIPILLAAPGQQTLSVKIFNYLHYGATEVISVLCLFMLLVYLFLVILIDWLVSHET